jgi:hypothetical protein
MVNGVVGPKPRKVALDEDVPVKEEKAVLQQCPRMTERTRRAERRIFGAVRNLHTEALAVAKMGFDAIGKMRRQEEHACETMALGQQNLVFQIRPAADCHHRLRD